MTDENTQDQIHLNDEIEAEQVAGDESLQKRLDWTQQNKSDLWHEIAQNNDLSHAEIVIMLDDAGVPSADEIAQSEVNNNVDASADNTTPATDNDATPAESEQQTDTVTDATQPDAPSSPASDSQEPVDTAPLSSNIQEDGQPTESPAPLETEEVQAAPTAEDAVDTEEVQNEPVAEGAVSTEKVQQGETGDAAKSDGKAEDDDTDPDAPKTAVVDGEEHEVVPAGDPERQAAAEAATSGEHTSTNGQPISDEAAQAAAADNDSEAAEIDRSNQDRDKVVNELRPEPSSTDDNVIHHQVNEDLNTEAIKAAADKDTDVSADTPLAPKTDNGERDVTDPDTVVLVEDKADAAAQQGPVVDSGGQQERNAQDARDGKNGVQAAFDRTDGASQVEQPTQDSKATAVFNSNKDTPANIPNTDTQMQVAPEGTAPSSTGDAVVKSVSDAPVQGKDNRLATNETNIPTPEAVTGQRVESSDTAEQPQTEANKQSLVVTRISSTLDEYVNAMAANRSIAPEVGARQQTKLLRALQAVIRAESNSDFVTGMDTFISRLSDEASGVFHDRYAFRFIPQMTVSTSDSLEFQHLLRLFTNIANPETRQSALEQTDVDVALKHTPEDKRERVKAYVNKIAG